MRDALILAGLTIGAIATLFPKNETQVPAKMGVRAAAETVAPASRGPANVLQRAADGHFYAGVAIGDRPVTMLVDTGASVVALTGEDARAAGLTWDPARLDVVARGAGGPIRGVALTLDRVALGGHEARDVRAVIVPEGLPVSLLGQSFLRTVEPVRIEKDRMVLGSV
ncbi:MAG: TIGR02281 family clan AA aspartic protease [Altererythrobacter sp.]|nr:TIGR02281 family clan AA aspartic protease [Altererythrobacter sp.]